MKHSTPRFNYTAYEKQLDKIFAALITYQLREKLTFFASLLVAFHEILEIGNQYTQNSPSGKQVTCRFQGLNPSY